MTRLGEGCSGERTRAPEWSDQDSAAETHGPVLVGRLPVIGRVTGSLGDRSSQSLIPNPEDGAYVKRS